MSLLFSCVRRRSTGSITVAKDPNEIASNHENQNHVTMTFMFLSAYSRPQLEDLELGLSRLSLDDFERVVNRRFVSQKLPLYHICLPSHLITEDSKRKTILEYWLEVDDNLTWEGVANAFYECSISSPFSILYPSGIKVPSACSIENTLTPSDSPTLAQLKKLPLSDESNVRIIDKVAAKWDEIAIAMDFDPVGHTQTAIDRDFSTVREKSTETFKKWLQGEGSKQPATWETLMEILKDCQFDNLASKIEKLF